MNNKYDVIIIGAGAAGLMCSFEAGKRGKKVCLLEHSSKIAEKIRISGGGRCNFTNLFSTDSNFISDNKHFCKSAFAKYTQNDFIDLVKKHNIEFFEKKLGQLFCIKSAKDIIDMLVSECINQKVEIFIDTKIKNLFKDENSYIVKTDKGNISSPSIVIATGGLSIPKIGATDFGYQIAKQFNLKVTELTPALVPLVFEKDILDFCKSLAGTSLNASIKINKTVFKEGLIFTHRGLSGPSILQISSYWVKDSPIKINLLPDQDIEVILKNRRISTPKQIVSKILSDYLPNKLSLAICDQLKVKKQIGDTSNQILKKVSNFVNNWTVVPSGTEGYKTAEVTLGGIDTKEISSSTMECKKHPGLYFIGEVLDVTGQLGGHNFQWAWSSGFLAGQYV